MRYGTMSRDIIRRSPPINRQAWYDGVRDAHVDRRHTDIDPARAMRHDAWLEYVGREDAERR